MEALLIIDMQYAFIDPDPKISGFDPEVIYKCAEAVSMARRNKVQIFWIYEEHYSHGKYFNKTLS